MMVVGLGMDVGVLFDIIEYTRLFETLSRMVLAKPLAMQTWDLSGQVVL